MPGLLIATVTLALAAGLASRARAAAAPAPSPIVAPARIDDAPPPAVSNAVPDAVTDGVRLAPATPGSVRFTIQIAPPQLTPAGAEDNGVTISLPGYDRVGEPGAPPVLRRIITVAVPPIGAVRVNAVASGLTSRDAVLLAALPGEDRAGARISVKRARAYAVAGTATPVAARLLQVSWIRNQRVAQIAIEPVAYEPSQRRLTSADRVDVDVQVQPLGSLGPPAEPEDPFETVYRATLLNYAQGKAWRRSSTATMAAAARRLGVPVEPGILATTLDTTSVLQNHSWVKLAVSTAGFYAVNFSTLRNTGLFGNAQTVPFDSLRVYTLPGYPLLPEVGFCDSCRMRQVAIGVANDAGADGMFNANTDAFYFFAQGPSGWASEFDPTLPETAFVNHPYDTKNYYYLTISGGADSSGAPVAETQLHIPTRDALTPTGGETVVTTFPDRVHFEEDHASEYWPDASPGSSSLTWEKWFWASNAQGDGPFQFRFDLPDADTTQAARLRLRDWGVTDNKSYINKQPCYGSSFDHYLDVTFNSLVFPERSWDGYEYDPYAERQAAQTYDVTMATVGTDAFLHQTGNLLQLVVPNYAFSDCPNRVDRSALAWFEIYYQHLLRPRADTLVFSSPGAAGPYQYKIGPFSRATPPRLFDVTNPLMPEQIRIAPSMWSAVDSSLTFVDSASVTRRYRVVPDSVIAIARMPATRIADAPSTSLLDSLRSGHNGADYVIIYYDGFQQAASLLAQERAKRLPLVQHGPPYLTKAIPVSALYDQFSGGRTDPQAIRSFLRSAYYNWGLRPSFVMFLGDASYDYKDLKGQAGAGRPGCLLPTFENDFDANNSILRQFATDDRLLNVTDPNSFIPDFFAGRIPAGDAQTALDAVRKLTAYDTSSPFGEYRNATLLLADDDIQGVFCDGLSWTHLAQTDDLNLRTLPLHEDRDYVYLHTFPTGAGSTKPGARNAVKDYLNGGVSIFNYIGHGSPFKVTDESVFIDTDASSLQNANRLFLFIAASCDVGKFNDPTVQSLGEDLVMAPTGGAVAVVSATEQALSGPNVNLTRIMYNNMFDRGTVAAGADTLPGVGQYHVPISAALTIAKIRSPGSTDTNNRKFQLMGDPATVLNAPHWWADFSLTDLGGTPITRVNRGQTVVFTGRVLDQPNGSLLPCNGAVNVLLEDSAPTNSTVGNGWDVPPFTVGVCPGSTIYRYASGAMYHGNVSVTNGVFQGRFVVPMDATLGTVGRARAYVQARFAGAAADSDGVGAITLAVAAGTADTSDTEGPRITLSFAGGAIAVHPDATLHIDLADPNGIMTTGHAQQNSIIVTVDGNTTKRTDVTSSFRYAADSYQKGTATFVLPGLTAGHHAVTVQAADNLATGITASQHRSSATLEFDVLEKATLHIDRAYLFPNPIRSRGAGGGGTFVIDAPGDPINTMIRIYTLSGRVVRTLKKFGGLGQIQLTWDGLDAEGEPLANGTYLFKVYANVRDADGASSPSEGDATVGRFVVVNR